MAATTKRKTPRRSRSPRAPQLRLLGGDPDGPLSYADRASGLAGVQRCRDALAQHQPKG